MNLYKFTGVVFNTNDRRNATNSILNGVCITKKLNRSESAQKIHANMC